MLCQQYHTSHLRLRWRSLTITALFGESPRFIHTIHSITLVVYHLSAVSHSIIKTHVSILSNTILTVLTIQSVVPSYSLFAYRSRLNNTINMSHHLISLDSTVKIRPCCVFLMPLGELAPPRTTILGFRHFC